MARPPKKNSAPRDLLARRLLQMERAQGATNARLDVSNERLAHLGRVVEQLADTMREGFRELRADFHHLSETIEKSLVVHHDRLDDMERRLTVLEAKGPAQ